MSEGRLGGVRCFFYPSGVQTYSERQRPVFHRFEDCSGTQSCSCVGQRTSPPRCIRCDYKGYGWALRAPLLRSCTQLGSRLRAAGFGHRSASVPLTHLLLGHATSSLFMSGYLAVLKTKLQQTGALREVSFNEFEIF